MANTFAVNLDTTDTAQTGLVIKVLVPSTQAQAIADLAVTHVTDGRYRSAVITGLAGSVANPAEYLNALYQGTTHHSTGSFWWNGADIVPPPSEATVDNNLIATTTATAVAAAVGDGTIIRAEAYTGGIIPQAVWESQGVPTQVSGDKVITPLYP